MKKTNLSINQSLLKVFVVMLFCLLCTVSFAKTFTVVNVNDTGTGSLRDAVSQANGLIGKDTIKFSITGSGLKTLLLQSDLPVMVDSIFINGFSQSGIGVNNIVIDGNNLVQNGLAFDQGSVVPCNSKIEGITIQNCLGAGIYTTSGVLYYGHIYDNCKISNCSIGISTCS